MIKVLKASAGSGKTYALAKEYIRLLLCSTEPSAYRHILAVTFTNKATDEMKRRILKELYILSTDPASSPYRKDFVPSLLADDAVLQKRAGEQLTAILHDYSAFSVSTIDKFFQQTLRAFSREIGQFASYQVDLDKPALIQESVDRVLDALTDDDSDLLIWLTEAVRSDLAREGKLRLEKKLASVAESLLSVDHEEALRRSPSASEIEWDKERLLETKKELEIIVGNYLDSVRTASSKIIDILKEKGIQLTDFSGGQKGFMMQIGRYPKLKPMDTVPVPTASFMSNSADPDKWFSKAKARMRDSLPASFEAMLEDFCSLFGERYRLWSTSRIILDQIYGLGVAKELRDAFTEIQKSKNVLSLDDSNTILRGIIDGTDAPFIYEKLGVRYEDFLLDEFQDTSTVQWDNFRPLLENSLSEGHDNLIVGDVKQSIYRWRGSDWDLLGSAVQSQLGVPSSDIVALENNYRTCRKIVKFNNAFFSYAASELDRLLGDDPKKAGSISEIYADVRQRSKFNSSAPGSVEVEFVDDQIKEILESIGEVTERGAGYGDITILVRNNDDGSAVAQALVDAGIPVISDDSLSVKSSVMVRRLVSQLSLSDESVSGEGRELVAGFLAKSLGLTVPESYHSLVDLSENLLRDLRKAYPETFRAEIPYIRSFMDYLQDWVSKGGNDLAAFLKDWELADPKIASPDVGSSVRVMTIHKSKGLEFKYVIIPFAEKVDLFKASSYWCKPEVDGTPLESVCDGVFNVRLSSSSDCSFFSEDYRRELKKQMIDNINVFYVAMTRPVYGLKIIAATPPKNKLDGDTNWKNMSQILFGFVKSMSSRFGEAFDFHGLERKAREEKPIPADFPSYPVNDRGRLRFSPEAYDYFWQDVTVGPHASARRRGLVLHKILSGVRIPSDLPRAVDMVVLSGELESSDRSATVDFLKAEIASVIDRGWFPEDGSGILNESAVYSTDGLVHRPDRVILHSDGSVDVIDYKFGSPKPSYHAQVRRYMDLFRSMGHENVRGYLWFIHEDAADEILEIR